MKKNKRVYLAGFDVFEPNSIELGKQYSEYAAQIGLVGLYPLDNEINLNEEHADKKIFQSNKVLLESADYVVANLNDFRGNEPDSGTVWEVAYAIGIGKKVIGYMNTNKTMVERLSEKHNVVESNGFYYDEDGKIVENFGNQLNLMLQHSIEKLIIGNVKNALDYVVELDKNININMNKNK